MTLKDFFGHFGQYSKSKANTLGGTELREEQKDSYNQDSRPKTYTSGADSYKSVNYVIPQLEFLLHAAQNFVLCRLSPTPT